MEKIKIIALHYLLRTPKYQNRDCWIHEIVIVRKKDFQILFPHLVEDPKKFFNYSWMPLDTYEEPMAAVPPNLQ